MDSLLRCSSESEKNRYLEHQNAELTDGYKKFLHNIIDPLASIQSNLDRGLDFGCGPYPMMSKLLSNEGFLVENYDPFFYPLVLDDKMYDFITLCEVIEHFSHPKLELNKIKKMLRLGGHLYIQTSLLHSGIDFKSWWYKDDITHVSFFSEKTIRYICQSVGFEQIEVSHKNIVILKSTGS